jgi:hypothetical protein
MGADDQALPAHVSKRPSPVATGADRGDAASRGGNGDSAQGAAGDGNPQPFSDGRVQIVRVSRLQPASAQGDTNPSLVVGATPDSRRRPQLLST